MLSPMTQRHSRTNLYATMMKYISFLLCLGLLMPSAWAEKSFNGKKVLFINSYHVGYEWSDGVEAGVKSVLADTGVELKTFYMDTKRQRSKEAIQQAARDAKTLIDSFQPDVVITADDNAAKHVIVPFYQDSDLPFVFCGVNWDASVYGFPWANVTGMEEVSLIKNIVKHLQNYKKGEGQRLGLLSIDAISGRRNTENFEKQLGHPFDKALFVKNFTEWKAAFLSLQDSVDMMILENPKGIEDWDNQAGLAFIQEHSRIPVGTTHVWLAPYALLAIAKIPQEQGQWAAQSALKVLSGIAIRHIPVVQNQQGRLIINLKLGEKLGVLFQPALLKTAEILR